MSQSRADGDEGGQVAVFCPESVADPTADTGSNEVVAAGVEFEECSAVSGIGAVDRVDDAQVIGMSGGVWEQFTNGQPAVAVLAKRPGRTEQLAGGCELDSRLVEGKRLAVVLLQSGLVIEGVDL
jgi:predicted methyltransferase MtxX (methanogen marker protein 4)